MRTAGLILGGIFLVDGLVALIGGRKAVEWAEHTLSPSLPRSWRRVLRATAEMDDTLLTTWGINNVAAGVGMILAASPPCVCEREAEQAQDEEAARAA